MLTPQSLSPTRDIQQQLFQQPDQQPSAYPPVGGRAISPNARRLSLSASGNPRYYSRDVASDPPTPILIVREESDVDANDPHCRFFVLESDVEPTEGWNTRHHKTQLSICFMHSFGKCVGRYQSDPSTCHQVHVRQTVMESLRARYIHPVRRFFSRTIKAHLTPDLLAVVSQVARKDLTLQYLEYLAHDVRETEGLHRYENAYRAWLTAPGGFLHAFHDTSVPQCTDYALRGQCAQERQCPCVHAHLCRAQVRDNIVMNALRIISAPFDHTSGSVSPTGEHDGARRLSPTVSPRYGNSRTTSQSSPNAGMLSGQISPVQFQQHQQQQHPHPHQRMMQMAQSHMNNPQQQPLHHYGNPQQQQVFVHQGPPPHLTMDGPQYMTVSPPNHQLGMQQTSPPTQPVYVVMMPQQSAVSPHHHMHQGGGSGAPSPQQAQLQPGAFQNAFLLPTYQTSLENSGRGAQLMPQQGGVLATGAFDDFQTRLDMGTLSGQTSPHSFISVDAFNQQQRSRSPNPQHSGTGIGMGNTAQPPFALSLNASGSSLWAPQTLTQQQPSPQPQPTTGGGGGVFIPAVYRVDQGSGMLVLEPQGIAK